MSNLPNSSKDKIKVYPNEYITNSTINRPNLRLLENDLYLENLVSGYDSSVLSSLSSQVNTNESIIDANTGNISNNTTNISALSARTDISDFTSLKVTLTSDQSIGAGNTSLVEFTSAEWDLNSEFDVSAQTFTATTSGIYDIKSLVSIPGHNSDDVTSLYLYKNNTPYNILASNKYHTRALNGATTVSLVSGDQLNIYCECDSAEVLDFTTVGTSGFYFCIDRIK